MDDDGFPGYDFEKEGVIGAMHNPDIEYWILDRMAYSRLLGRKIQNRAAVTIKYRLA